MEKKCAGTQIAHVIAIHAKTAHLALALMAFQVNLTNEVRKCRELSMKKKSKMSPWTVNGHWFVHFGAGISADSPKVEGSKIVEITGTFDGDEFLDLLSKRVFDSLSQAIKDLISENDLTLIIKSLSKLD